MSGRTRGTSDPTRSSGPAEGMPRGSLPSERRDDGPESTHRPTGKCDVADAETLSSRDEILDKRRARTVHEERGFDDGGDRRFQARGERVDDRPRGIGHLRVEDDDVELQLRETRRA